MTPSLDRAEVALRLACASASNFHGAPLPPKEFAASILSYADALLLALTPPVAGPCPGEDARDDAEARARVSAPVAPKSEAAKYEPAPGDVIDLYGGRGSCEPHMTRIAVNRDEYAALNCGKFEARYRYDLHPTVTPVFLRPATPAERSAAGLPSPEATRPTHVRITGPADAVRVTIGKVYAVKSWDKDGCPEIVNDDGWDWFLPDPSDTQFDSTWPAWEPADAPKPPAPVEPAKGEDKYAELVDAARRIVERVECLGSVSSVVQLKRALAIIDGSAS